MPDTCPDQPNPRRTASEARRAPNAGAGVALYRDGDTLALVTSWAVSLWHVWPGHELTHLATFRRIRLDRG